jgi:hypothetical protein
LEISQAFIVVEMSIAELGLKVSVIE